MVPIHAKHSPFACFFTGSTALSLECLCKDCQGNRRYMGLPLERLSSEQNWRSPVVSVNLFLQIEAGKLFAACCLFFPEGGLLFPHPANFLSQAPGKALHRVPFLRAVIPEPGVIGSSPTLKRKGTATSTHPLRPFCSVGEV